MRPKLSKNTELAMFLLLKSQGSAVDDILHCIGGLGRSFTSTRGEDVTLSNPLYLVGKYDVGVIIRGPDLGAISRLSYLLIRELESICKDALLDFTRIPAFSWPNFSTITELHRPIALIQLKLSKPLESFRHRTRPTLLESLRDLTDFEFLTFGGLAWHELVLALCGSGLGDLHSFLQTICSVSQISNLVGEISSIPAWLPDHNYADFDLDLIVSLKVDRYNNIDEIGKALPGLRPSFGFIDLYSNANITSMRELEDHLAGFDRLEKQLGFRKYSSILSPERFQSLQARGSGFVGHKGPSGAPTQDENREPVSPTAPSFLQQDAYTRRNPVLQEKVEAVRIQLKVLRNDPRFRYLVPLSLVETLNALDFESPFSSRSEIAGYISTLRHAVQQRVCGTYPAAATGFITGYADGYGGYQRILLAAESLLSRCLKVMLGSKFKLPPILVLFDQRGLHQSDFSTYEAVRKIHRRAPLIVRLRSLKYEPWMWHRGIRDIAQWCVEFERFFRQETGGSSFFGFSSSGVGVFVCRVLSKAVYTELQAFESDWRIATPRSDGNWNFQRLAYEQLRLEMAGCQDIRNGPEYSLEQERVIAGRIENGDIFPPTLEDGLNFQYFVNGYYSLPIEVRRTPRAMIAFLMSLYSNYQTTYAELDDQGGMASEEAI